MAIAVSCPACEHALRVKDDLAGRRIRCPKCQGAVSVPGPVESRMTAKAPSKPPMRRPIEEEEEDDDRPRKKKKKKKGASNKGLWIGLGVGGAVIGAVVTAVVLIMNRKPPEPPPVVQPAPPKRIVGREEDEASLKTLWTVYRGYCDRERKGPENLKELEPDLTKHPKTLKLLADGKVTCQYGVIPDKLEHENKALAFDSQPDAQGLRYVLMGDQRVMQMDVLQFEKTGKITAQVVAAPDPTKPPKVKLGGIPRFKDKIEADNALRGVALAYRNFSEQQGRPPLKLEELESYYDKNPRITEAIKVGTLKIVWNQRVADSAEILIAFEADSDANGRRVIVTASAAPRLVTEFEFQEMLKGLSK